MHCSLLPDRGGSVTSQPWVFLLPLQKVLKLLLVSFSVPFPLLCLTHTRGQKSQLKWPHLPSRPPACPRGPPPARVASRLPERPPTCKDVLFSEKGELKKALMVSSTTVSTYFSSVGSDRRFSRLLQT